MRRPTKILFWLSLIALWSAGNLVSAGRAFGELQKLTASDGEAADIFSVALAIDGDTALVGALQHDVGANTDQGAVYVYVRNGGVWTEQTQLVAEDGEAFDGFGAAVALDGNTALIGALYGNVDGNTSQGAAYIFVRNGNTWTQQAKLTSDDGNVGDYFGGEVALDGDTALIGAFNHDIGANNDQGAAYVYVRSETTWTQQQKLTADDGAADDWFGTEVAVEGDTAFVGSIFDDVGANVDQGSVYVYTRSGTTWTQQDHLIAADGAAGDEFGNAMALEGDTVLIAALFDDTGANDQQGSVYVYERSSNIWTEAQKLTASDGIENETFGTAVALDGKRALIGAGHADINANVDQGAAYVFAWNSGVWTEQTKVTAGDGEAGDQFGADAALSGNTALIGAHFDTVGVNDNQGSAYIFVDPTLTDLVQNGGFEDSAVTPWMIKNASGDKVKCDKDKDGDGIPDKIVAYAGSCAFQFKNIVGEAGKIQQNLDVSGIAPAVGDSLDLSFYAQSKGGATVKVKVVFKYGDDTKTKINVESSGLETYAEFTGNGSLTSSDIVKAKINFKSIQTSGKVFLDGISLLHVPNESGLVPLPAANANNRRKFQ